MREAIEERESAGARLRFSRSEVALLVVGVLAVVHQVDHVLRADHSGWPFTASLLVYPVLLATLLFRRRPWIRLGLVATLLVALQVTHMFFETPADQYGTWAHGVSSALHAIGRPNLLGISSPALGIVSVSVSLVLSVALAVVLVLLTGEVRRLRRVGRTAAVIVLVLILLTDLSYGWAAASTGSAQWARMVVWQGSDVLDHQRFPARPVRTRQPAFRFLQAPGADRLPVRTVPVQEDGGVVERDLAEFLRSTGTTAFIAIKGGTIVSEVYFNGYRHDSTFASFSVAKPFVSALIGIALADGHLGSLDDPITKYVPELAKRDTGFGRINLRHLLTMSSGLAHEDPYYALDLRAVALQDTKIERPPGERFRYNNINTILLGLALERATGRPVSAYLQEKLWGPLGMEADGSWSVDSEKSQFEQMQAGLNGRAVDFAKFGALYLNKGVWQGRQLIPRAWATASTQADTTTDPSPIFQYNWWTRPNSGTPNDFWAQGNHGQFIYLAPEQDVVLVRFGIEYNYTHWPDLLSGLARRL
ncbi:serine hydrolase domain-containing protein [Nonomuraea basaltis]|uniref:serine hydrolase domain-containing protein n=1 Tax=Nonomuraea basaltis TaxID=2495887 RepID=UPI00110C4E96|nr:serine hydrolase [Nonomuraea basaltis]TMR88658.1 serine hydrolase [Nonomuraea basaltis]